MSYEPFPFPSFGGGLNLRDKSDAIAEEEAVDCLNVFFTERGAVTQRHGYADLTTSPLTNRGASLEPFYTSSGTKQLLVGCGTRLEALTTAGAVAASQTGLTDGVWDFVRFGGPGAEVAYAGNGKNLLQKWSGSAWSSVANSPKASCLAVQQVDQGNRLVAAGFDSGSNGPSAATANPSRVWFSDAGAPETFGANNYVDVAPGDGEAVKAVIAWRESVFVFKETKFFVFYGTHVDAGGDPVFSYRTVDTGVGLASSRAVTVDERGIYFLSRHGVFSTTGDEPQVISEPIQPIFTGDVSGYYQGGTLNHASIANTSMASLNHQLYLGIATAGAGANDRTLIYDTRYGWWSLWDTPAAAFAKFRIADREELVFALASGDNDVVRMNDSQTSDRGTAITSRWRSGWFDYGSSDQKTLREAKLWGQGVVTVGSASDFATANAETASLDFSSGEDLWGSGANGTWGSGTAEDAWGPTQVLRPKMFRKAVHGTTFSISFSNSTLDQSWAIHRLAAHVRETRIPTVISQ